MNALKPTPEKPKFRDSHRLAAHQFLDKCHAPFRRSDLSKIMYKLTSPRSLSAADHLANAAFKILSNEGRIQRHGHLHWVKVEKARKLLSGRVVPVVNDTVCLKHETHCPEKWVSIDLETGQVWSGSTKGWRLANADQRKDILACLKQ